MGGHIEGIPFCIVFINCCWILSFIYLKNKLCTSFYSSALSRFLLQLILFMLFPARCVLLKRQTKMHQIDYVFMLLGYGYRFVFVDVSALRLNWSLFTDDTEIWYVIIHLFLQPSYSCTILQYGPNQPESNVVCIVSGINVFLVCWAAS